jgi:asparagine synthase (glutamine-hydrolysing)
MKLRGLTTKYILKRALRGRVPSSCLSRPKRGFAVPIGKWLRGPMLPFLHATLLSDRSQGRGLFRAAAVRQLIDEHIAGKRDHAHRLWALLMLELWFARFIDSALSRPPVGEALCAVTAAP